MLNTRPLIVLTWALFLAACAPGQATPDAGEVARAVMGTLVAMPSQTPLPSQTPAPSPTVDVRGLFCEYGFCIGHPDNVPFSDLNDPPSSSAYAAGRIFAYTNDMFILVVWVQSSGAWDPQGMLRPLLTEFGDTPSEELQYELIGPLDVAQYAITPTALSTLQYGRAATWRCGNRDFVWKVYTGTDAASLDLLRMSLARFACAAP